MDASRPVLVNSLLCFVHNFWGSARLRDLVKGFFPSQEQEEAELLLEQRSGCKGDVFELYQKLRDARNLPYFAAADLTSLPMCVLEANEKHEILREVRALRRFIGDALNGRMEDNPAESRFWDQEDLCIPPLAVQKFVARSPPPVTPSKSPDDLHTSSSSSSTTSSSTDDNTATTVGDLKLEIEDMAEDDRIQISPESVSASECCRNSRKRSAPKSLDEPISKMPLLSSEATSPLSEEGDSRPPTPLLPMATVPPPLSLPWPGAVDGYLSILQRIVHNNAAMAAAAQAHAMGRLFEPHSPSPSSKLDVCSPDEEELKVDDGDEAFSRSLSPTSSDEKEADNENDEAEKPFVCPHSNCAKRFANKFLLKKHQFIHTGLRPHACPYCIKRFNRKDNLLRHKKTHFPNIEGDRSHEIHVGGEGEDDE